MAKGKVATLKGKKRDEVGTRASKKMRKEGMVPAVLYGHKLENVNLSIPLEDFNRFLRSGSRILNLRIGRALEQALLKDVQYDIYSENILHADFARISLDEKVTINVPIEMTGTAPGQKEGGIVDQPIKHVEVETLATNIPEYIEVDISSLNINDVLTIADMHVPEGVLLKANPQAVVIRVVPPVEEVEEVPVEEAAAAAEPEVITAKKEEAEEGEESGAAEKAREKEK